MTKALLEVIAAGVVKDVAHIERFLRFTFVGKQISREKLIATTRANLQYLVDARLIEYASSDPSEKRAPQMLRATRLGCATFAAGVLSPEDALFVHAELEHARNKLLLHEDLHLLYLVTPLEFNGSVDWSQFTSRFERSLTLQKVAAAVRVEEAFLQHAAQHPPPRFGAALLEPRYRRHRRFYSAVILYDLVREVDLEEIMKWTGASRGELQSLQSSAASFAGCLAKFCERYGWSDFRILIAQFVERINAGVKKDLVDLVRIPYVKSARARALHRAGLSTVELVARSSQGTLIEALRKASRSRDEERTLVRSARLILAGARELKSKDGLASERRLKLMQVDSREQESDDSSDLGC